MSWYVQFIVIVVVYSKQWIMCVHEEERLIWSKSYLSLCIFYMIKFTSYENISRLWV
jgi:hypothetical protein